MKITVMGAGSVGCFYGGMLARGGHEITLIGRESHVNAIQQHGLHLETIWFDEFVPVLASSDVRAAEGAELILFSVKSNDTEKAAGQIKPYIANNVLIVTLQNGVDNAQRVRDIVLQDVSAAVVYVASEMVGAGHVQHYGRGDLIVEPGAAGECLAKLMNGVGVSTEVSHNVRGALWSKLILNCAYNAISALVHLPFGDLCRYGGERVETSMVDIVEECLAVAHADGVDIPGTAAETVEVIMSTIPLRQYSSTAQDLSRNKKTEIEHLNGLIVKRGQALGIPTPLNSLLLMLIGVRDKKQADSPFTMAYEGKRV